MMKLFLRNLFLIAVIFLPASLSYAGQNISGKVLEKGTQKPLSAVNVFLLNQDPAAAVKSYKAESDLKGLFQFSDIPEGNYKIVINLSGYFRFDANLSEIPEGEIRKLYLEKENYNGFEIVVTGARDKKDSSVKKMTQKEFLQLPGSGGDPVKAVQNLPGVNRVAGFSSQVVIQGSSPNDTKYKIDGHDVPAVFHFGGLTSVVTPEAVSSVDYFSAGFDGENGRAIGGVVSLKTRNPELDGREKKGFFFADLFKTGGLIEAKIDDSSEILAAGRYSYIGKVLEQALKDNKAFNLTVVPEFADLNLNYHKKLNELEDFRVVALYSKDSLGFLFKEPVREDPGFRGTFKNETQFWRIIPQYQRKISNTESYDFSVGVGQNKILVDLGDNYFKLDSNNLSTLGAWNKELNPEWKIKAGFDNEYSRAKVSVRLPVAQIGSGGVSQPFSTLETRQTDVAGKINNVGLYLLNEVKPMDSKFIYKPNFRFESFSQTKEKILMPRLGLDYQMNESLLIKSAGGYYTQAPQPQEVDEVFGNPQLKAPKALHGMFGFEKDFREGRTDGFTWNSGLFYRWFYDLIITSSALIERNGSLQSETYNNSGKGKAYGFENWIKYRSGPFSGWLSYTISRSTRFDPTQEEYVFQYDQTHNVNLVGSFDASNNWKYSGRIRYVTGNPETPITGSYYDADKDVYIPVRGIIYSQRKHDFYQLDLRFDKQWIKTTEIWSLYLDIQNVLNTQNEEGVRYSYDYSQRKTISGLPILPMLGVKGEF